MSNVVENSETNSKINTKTEVEGKNSEAESKTKAKNNESSKMTVSNKSPKNAALVAGGLFSGAIAIWISSICYIICSVCMCYIIFIVIIIYIYNKVSK